MMHDLLKYGLSALLFYYYHFSKMLRLEKTSFDRIDYIC